MLDHVRRAVVVLLTALALLVGPQVAHAAFLAQAAPSLAVSTASLSEPGNVSLTPTCRYTGFLGLNRGLDVTVNSSSGNDYPGVTFTYSVFRGNAANPADTETTASRSATLNAPGAVSLSNVTFRVTIQARLQSWTGPTFTRDITC